MKTEEKGSAKEKVESMQKKFDVSNVFMFTTSWRSRELYVYRHITVFTPSVDLCDGPDGHECSC